MKTKNMNKHRVWIIWSEEQTNKAIEAIQDNKKDTSLNPCLYQFDTKKELDAFILGVEEAIGWMEYVVISSSQVKLFKE